MEERIIAYLLGECDEQEAFEVEKMCREDAKWQAEKIRYGQVLGLMEESISQTTPELLPEKEAKLTEDQRNEIKSLLATNSPTSAKIEDEEMNKNMRKENIMTDKQNKDKNSKILYWAPLTAAAVAAIIAYFGNPEDQSQEMIAKATNQATPSDQNQTFSSDKFSNEGSLAESKNVEKISYQTEIALQKAIADGANEALALRTSSEIRDMEKATIDDLPTGKELIKKLEERNVTVENSNSDDLFAGKSSPFPSLSLAENFARPLSKIPEMTDEAASSSNLLKRKTVNLNSKDGNESLNVPKRETAEISEEKISWFSVITEPEESFIFNEKRDSLGKIRILGNTVGKIIFERANWSNKNRNFRLKSGIYEIRLSRKKSGTLIVKGNVSQANNEGTYELSISEAWELDNEEKRNSLPIEKLNP